MKPRFPTNQEAIAECYGCGLVIRAGADCCNELRCSKCHELHRALHRDVEAAQARAAST